MYQVEHTDTFGTEANYSWVNRYVIADIPNDGSDFKAVGHCDYPN